MNPRLIFPGHIQVRGRDKSHHDPHFGSCQIGGTGLWMPTLWESPPWVRSVLVLTSQHETPRMSTVQGTDLRSTSPSTWRTPPKDLPCLSQSPTPDHFAKMVESPQLYISNPKRALIMRLKEKCILGKILTHSNVVIFLQTEF